MSVSRPEFSTKIAAPLMTRPADTTAYASGDLVANHATAASVVPLVFSNVGRRLGSKGWITRARLTLSLALIANAAFRLHLFNVSPVATVLPNGDNGALVPALKTGYQGFIDLVATQAFAFGDGTILEGVPIINSVAAPNGLPFTCGAASDDLWGLLEARAAYVPASAETFLVEIWANRLHN